MPPLIVVDVGSTLGQFTGDGRSTTNILADLVPPTFPRHLITRTVCRVLHRVDRVTEEVIREVCDELHVDRDRWPDPWPASGFDPYEDTNECLARLNRVAPVVALSNLSVTGAPRLDALADSCGKYLGHIYSSYQLGACKPARWLWRYVADHHGARSDDVIHIGDRWAEDVLGPLSVGGRAIWVNHSGLGLPPKRPAQPDRLAMVGRLAAAADVVERWLEPPMCE
jgi:FMN phosphatase YigB (HAD superfamily)